MRKKFLNFIIGMLVSLPLILAPITVGAAETNTEKIQVINITNSESEFVSFLDKMKKLDITALDDEDIKVYDAFKMAYSKYVKSKNIELTEQELTLRINILFSLFNGYFSSEDFFDSGLDQFMKYLQIESTDDAINILKDVYITLYGKIGGEFQTFLVESLILDLSILSGESKKIYEKIYSIAKERYGDEAEEGARMMLLLLSGGNGRYSQGTLFIVTEFLRYSLREYSDFAISLIKDFSGYFKNTSEIVDSLYINILFREVDEEGLKFWTSKADEIIKEGKSKSDIIDILSKEIFGSKEYKNLEVKYKEFISNIE